MNFKKTKKNKGFTLIEILVVIGIIAILAAIVIVAINPSRQFAQSRNTQRVSNVNAILNAIGQYIADNKGDLPTDVDGVTNKEITAGLCSDLVPTYLPSLPTDPDSSSNGSLITTCSDINTAGEVDYQITEDSNGRITVNAPNAELSQTISVTR
jgi:prepilin-type N-terminal cleavage/methylation domain-containing protein